jgi:hypothetical protein
MPDLLERFFSRERSKRHVFWGSHILDVYQDQSDAGLVKVQKICALVIYAVLASKDSIFPGRRSNFFAINHGHFDFWNEADMACCG